MSAHPARVVCEENTVPSRPLVGHAIALGVVGVLTVAAALFGAAPASASSTGTIAGTVRDAMTSIAVGAGVIVTARTPSNKVLATTTTVADGSYTLPGVPAGDRVVCFDGAAMTATWAAGYLFACSGNSATAAGGYPVHIGTGATTSLDAALDPATVVSGRVTDPGGAGLAKVTVDIGQGGPTVTTRADGAFRFVFDANRNPDVRPCFAGSAAKGGASTVGYLAACWTDAANDYEATTQPGQILTVDQVLQPAAAIAGRVTDTAGNAISGVRVTVSVVGSSDGGTSATTTTDGSYRVVGLPSDAATTVSFVVGSTTAGPSPLGYQSQCWRGVAYRNLFCGSGTTPVTTPVGSTRTDISPHLQPAGAITGRVTDAQGRPVPQVPLRLTPIGFSGSPAVAVTAADGSYRAVGLVPSRYTVCFADDNSAPMPSSWPDQDGYSARCWLANTRFGDPVTVTAATTTTGIDITLVGKGGITGRVNSPSGAPVTGVRVSVSGPSATDFLDNQDGTFSARQLAVGTYTVCFSTDPSAPTPPPLGWVRQCQQVVVNDDTTTSATPVTMVAAGALAGRVTDAYGFVVQQVIVTVTGADGTVTSSDTASDGTYTAGALAPGTYTVCFDPAFASRVADGTRPPNGWASQCWKRQVSGGTPTPVTVTGGRTTTGIGAALVAARATTT